MSTGIILAIVSGILISLNRIANGRVGLALGAFKASYWNHLVGLVFLSVLLLVIQGFVWEQASHAPWYAYLGGVLGTFFVAINSYVIPRLGVTKTALAVISGQMGTGVLLHAEQQSLSHLLLQCLGVVFILAGIIWAQRHKT